MIAIRPKPVLLTFITITVFSMFPACSKVPDTITVYEMESFAATKPDSVQVITDPDLKRSITAAFRKAVKQPGNVNISNPQYKVELGEEVYFLWTSEKRGTIMNVKETHTIYSLPEASASEVYNAIHHIYTKGAR